MINAFEICIFQIFSLIFCFITSINVYKSIVYRETFVRIMYAQTTVCTVVVRTANWKTVVQNINVIVNVPLELLDHGAKKMPAQP